jgi:capsular exopolysaccharide synthesis family protein
MTGFNRNTSMEYRPPEQPQQQDPNQEPHRRNALRGIWQQRWIVVGVLVLAVAAGVIYIYRATPIFQSASRISIDQNGARVIRDIDGYVGPNPNFLVTQCQIIKSRAILGPVADRPEVRKMACYASNADNFVAYLQSKIYAEPGRRDDIITVAVKSPSADEAAQLCNFIVESYQDFLTKQKKNVASETLKALRDQKQAIDAELDKTVQLKKEFQQKNAAFSFASDSINPIYTRLGELMSAKTRNELDKYEAKENYTQAKDAMKDPAQLQLLLDTLPNRSSSYEIRRDMREAQIRLASVQNSYLPGSTVLTGVQAQLKQLAEEQQEEDKKLATAYLAECERKFNSCIAFEKQIVDSINQQQAQVLDYNSKAAEFQSYESRISSLLRRSDDYEMQIRGINLTEDVSPMNVNVLEMARAEGAPIEPDEAKIMFQALLAGLALGVGLAWLRDISDQRLRSADEIKGVVNLPILGVVPHIQHARTPSQRGMQLHNDPMSDVAEAYRTIRTAVYFGVPHGTAKTLLVTSPAPGDGKTTLASNLAIAMAQAGNRILLIDADFRKPMQHKIFELGKSAGLSSVLAGEAELEQAIHKTPVNGLEVLPCGPIPANPSEILNSQMFADVLNDLVTKYDHVVIDSPPVMPVTDSRILAASCDCTILALRAEKSTRKSAVYARDTLRSVGSRILGVVVNDVPRKKGIYGYYYTEAEVYTYGYGATNRKGANGSKSKSNGAETPAKEKELV